MVAANAGQTEKSPVLGSHRVPAHLARRFNQICIGVTAEILFKEDLTPQAFGVMAAVSEAPGSGQRQLANQLGIDVVSFGQLIDLLETVLKETKVEEHRTRAPSFREIVLQKEQVIVSLLRKLGKPAG